MGIVTKRRSDQIIHILMFMYELIFKLHSRSALAQFGYEIAFIPNGINFALSVYKIVWKIFNSAPNFRVKIIIFKFQNLASFLLKLLKFWLKINSS